MIKAYTAINVGVTAVRVTEADVNDLFLVTNRTRTPAQVIIRLDPVLSINFDEEAARCLLYKLQVLLDELSSISGGETQGDPTDDPISQ